MEKKFTGLSDQEVIQRINEGKVNNVDNKITKSYKEIFINNTITFFKQPQSLEKKQLIENEMNFYKPTDKK